ncbi:MAG: hypothetical protein COW32_03500 [Candidatus Aquicultor secundus]|uniref:Uncharacterized protein n=1 Tax=Candidatus Aquicultor secundus TaxID=1973895 RepID=A0A2M7T748_9ACTN|nr:hypothetical protein [Candidatus Aquicultor secundus]PIU27633.1 MAG: hypothetical protein COT10_02445 [Candidatus Aquicultor secundus]PIW22640.1 MAG: hypothetical protein COW32_03500 [Candidatus Aquicultor secundus]PIX51389.1 MAG: hypothetical protein COZ51_09915 [Candidatus Aquicultor secundus]PIY38953.1 MAG: hypothetical protein COZ03_07015 [Candidatus Aquicultor secundus]PIZ37310.1 MAG: hypothetical protein COY37_07390 [Candidatus Aquicultor secundus]
MNGSNRLKEPRWFIGIAVLVLIIAAVGLVGLDYKNQEPAKPAVKISDFSESRLKTIVGDSSGIGISEVTINKRSGLVTIFYIDDSARDENAIMFSLSIAAVRIMPPLFKIDGVKKVKVVELGTFMNDAGDSSVDQSAAITISKKKADMLDWGKVNLKNKAGLLAEATELYINPAIKNQIDDLDVLNAIIVQLSNKHE